MVQRSQSGSSTAVFVSKKIKKKVKKKTNTARCDRDTKGASALSSLCSVKSQHSVFSDYAVLGVTYSRPWGQQRNTPGVSNPSLPALAATFGNRCD